jgi:hypothetical protein
MPRFIVIGHHKDDSYYDRSYPSVDAAVRGEMQDPLEYTAVFELGTTIHGHYAFNVTEDFIAAWIEREEESLADKYWADCVEATGETLEHYQELYAQGPVIRRPSKRQPQLIAAE